MNKENKDGIIIVRITKSLKEELHKRGIKISEVVRKALLKELRRTG